MTFSVDLSYNGHTVAFSVDLSCNGHTVAFSMDLSYNGHTVAFAVIPLLCSPMFFSFPLPLVYLSSGKVGVFHLPGH